MDPQRRRFFTGRAAASAQPPAQPTSPGLGTPTHTPPAGAPPTLAAATHWQIVLADTCLMRQRVECRACAEACDTRALRWVPAVGGAQLALAPLRCTGCGECLPGCPVQAITLVPPLPEGPPAGAG